MASHGGDQYVSIPAVLQKLVAAARRLPPDAQRGPFHGIGGGDGLTVAIGRAAIFLSDDDAGDLSASDYLDIASIGSGDGSVTLLPRAFAAVEPTQEHRR